MDPFTTPSSDALDRTHTATLRLSILRRWSHTKLRAAQYSSLSLASAIHQAPALIDHRRVMDARVDSVQLLSLLALLRAGQHTTLLAEGCSTRQRPCVTPAAARSTTSRMCQQQDATPSLRGPLLGLPEVALDLNDPNVNDLYNQYLAATRHGTCATVPPIDALTRAVSTMLQCATPSPSACAAAVVLITDVLVDRQGRVDPSVITNADHLAWHSMRECVARMATANARGALQCAEDVTMVFEAAGRLLGHPPGGHARDTLHAQTRQQRGVDTVKTHFIRTRHTRACTVQHRVGPQPTHRPG